MNGKSNRGAAVLAALVIGGLATGNALAAGHDAAGASVGGGSQVRPGGLVTDRSGGSFDPSRSIYSSRSSDRAAAGARPSATKAELAALRVRSIALNEKYGLGPDARRASAAATVGDAASGFSWADASVGASVGAASILAFCVAFVMIRWRRKPVL